MKKALFLLTVVASVLFGTLFAKDEVLVDNNYKQTYVEQNHKLYKIFFESEKHTSLKINGFEIGDIKYFQAPKESNFTVVEWDRKFYIQAYIDGYNSPLLTAYIVDPKLTKFHIKKRPYFYSERKYLPKNMRVTSSDYSKGVDGNKSWRVDKGHVSPDAVFDWDKEALKSVYNLTNITPQYPATNRGVWRVIEAYIRSRAESTGDKLLVWNLVVFTKSPEVYPRIGKHGKKVGQAVPDSYVKCYIRNQNEGGCFAVENSPEKSHIFLWVKFPVLNKTGKMILSDPKLESNYELTHMQFLTYDKKIEAKDLGFK